MKSATVVKILEKAKKRIARKGGFLKGGLGAWGEPTGPVCMLGALDYAYGEDIEDVDNGPGCQARKAVEAVVGGNIPNFNDTKKRTQAQVIAAFDKAIARRRKIDALLARIEKLKAETVEICDC